MSQSGSGHVDSGLWRRSCAAVGRAWQRAASIIGCGRELYRFPELQGPRKLGTEKRKAGRVWGEVAHKFPRGCKDRRPIRASPRTQELTACCRQIAKRTIPGYRRAGFSPRTTELMRLKGKECGSVGVTMYFRAVFPPPLLLFSPFPVGTSTLSRFPEAGSSGY
jgi:hypothetical protein